MQALISDLKNALTDFAPDNRCSDPYPWGRGYLKLSDEERESLPPDSVFIGIVKFAKFPFFGRDEKIKWTIPISFRGIPFVLMHQKFGFKISALDPERNSEQLTNELIGRLRRVVRIVDKLIEPFATEQVRKGNVTIGNRYPLFRNMYEFLRGKAREAYASPPPPAERLFDKDGKPTGWHSRPLPELDGFYFAAPALDSYYSLLEHLLILLFAFARYDPKTDDLVRFITGSWGQNFKRVFDVVHDPVAKKAFDSLVGLKDRLRNPLSHGGVEAEGKHTLHFHVPDVGAVPLSVSRYKDSIHYTMIPIGSRSFEEICGVLDDVDTFFENGPLRLGFAYVRSGLDVAFDSDSLRDYSRASASDEEMEEFIEYTVWHYDQAANMDW